MKNKIIRLLFLVPSLAFLCSYPKNVKAQNSSNNQKIAGIIDITNTSLQKELSKELYCCKGYITASNLNVRLLPDSNSEIQDKLPFNAEIDYIDYDDEWAMVQYNSSNYFISKKYISDSQISSQIYSTPYNHIKSYMPFQAITSKISDQYKLQQIAYTGQYGIRQVNGRYCIAVGSAYTTIIGQYIDLVLDDGTIIPCVLGDCKADKDTNSSNTLTNDGSLAEFIVDIPSLSRTVTYTGDISTATEDWESMITSIIVYDKVEEL